MIKNLMRCITATLSMILLLACVAVDKATDKIDKGNKASEKLRGTVDDTIKEGREWIGVLNGQPD